DAVLGPPVSVQGPVPGSFDEGVPQPRPGGATGGQQLVEAAGPQESRGNGIGQFAGGSVEVDEVGAGGNAQVGGAFTAHVDAVGEGGKGRSEERRVGKECRAREWA